MLETHGNEWKHRCNLNFTQKSIIHNNQFMSFHKRSLLITVDHFLSKMDRLSLQKQNWGLNSKNEYQKIYVKQLTQWIANTKCLFKSNRSYKNNNRKITEYFGKDFTRENNISKNYLLNKLTTGEDNDNNIVHSNNYLDKNQKWFRTSGKNIDDLIYFGEEDGTKHLTEPPSILPSPTDTNPCFEINRAEQNISKKM